MFTVFSPITGALLWSVDRAPENWPSIAGMHDGEQRYFDGTDLQDRNLVELQSHDAMAGDVTIWPDAPACYYSFDGTEAFHGGGDLTVSVTEAREYQFRLVGQYKGDCIITVNDLAGWKAHFGAEVDAQHRVIERKVISEGQTIIDRYRRKQIEVPLARAKLEAGQPLDPAETPLIAVAVARIQTVNPSYDPMKKVIEIEQNATSWVPLDVAVEAERDGVKTLIRDATTLAEIEAAFATLAWPI